MRAEPTPEPGDRDERPFSNGTEGDMWLSSVCGAGAGCIHDSTYGQGDPNDETWCPLITLSLIGVWPHEWEHEAVEWQIGEKSGTYYRTGGCSEFTDEPIVLQPDPVVAIDLFGTYSAEPNRMEVDA